MNMIIATHNAHKIEEFGRILAPLGITVQTTELTEAEETGAVSNTLPLMSSRLKIASAACFTTSPSMPPLPIIKMVSSFTASERRYALCLLVSIIYPSLSFK